MDLPTYTNIWRIEKRLYKLYDFRLPAPLPITWIGVFTAITVPYVIFLIAIGLPFNHNLVWLYILPPGVLTWLTTRPVIESKRLPELVSSQLRYIAEPQTWCRMAPFAEKDDIVVSARVWHSHPPKVRPKKAKRAAVEAPSSAPAVLVAGAGLLAAGQESPRTEVRPVKARPAAAPLLASAQQTAPPAPASSSSGLAASPPSDQMPVPERALARRAPKPAKPQPGAKLSWSPWPQGSERDTAPPVSAAEPGPEPEQRPAWMISPYPAGAPDARALEVAHDSDPGLHGLDEPHAPPIPPSWPAPQTSLLPLIRRIPKVGPFPEAGPFPEDRSVPRGWPLPGGRPVPRGQLRARAGR